MNDEINYNQDTWDVVNCYLSQYKGKQLIRHHIDSFNDFMDNKILSIVKQFNPLIVYHEYIPESNSYKYEIHIEYGNIYFDSPTIYENDGSSKPMYPHEARLRNLTYAVSIYMDLTMKVITNSDNENDFIEKFKYYIEHEEERIKIVNKAYEYFLEKHTWEHKVKHLLDNL